MVVREKFFPIQVEIIRRINPRVAPISGARKIKIIVLVHPDRITTWSPPFAIAAPRYPPRRACDELVGRASHQVRMFQLIAQNKAQNITRGVTKDISIIPFPIVFATAVPTMKIATKLKVAAHKTAYFGESTLVATTVAIELALSCIPLVKSKMNAIRIITVTNGYCIIRSRICERNSIENSFKRSIN